jgi:hypothetical protein
VSNYSPLPSDFAVPSVPAVPARKENAADMNAADAEKIILLLDSEALGVLDPAAKAKLRTAAESALGRFVAEVVKVGVDRRGVRTVTVKCPHCSRRHTHGWPQGDAEPGLRRPHCRNGVGDYFISAPVAA